MSTVFTGESKIFQLAAVNPEAFSNKVEQVAINVPLIEKMIDSSFDLAKSGAQAAHTGDDTIFKKAFNTSYEQVEELTNNFIAAMERVGMPWAEQFAAWQTYQRQMQIYCSEKLSQRLQQWIKDSE